LLLCDIVYTLARDGHRLEPSLRGTSAFVGRALAVGPSVRCGMTGGRSFSGCGYPKHQAQTVPHAISASDRIYLGLQCHQLAASTASVCLLQSFRFWRFSIAVLLVGAANSWLLVAASGAWWCQTHWDRSPLLGWVAVQLSPRTRR